MIELQDDQCIRIGDTFAIIGTVEGMAAQIGMEPKAAEQEYRMRRMPLVWAASAPMLPLGLPGYSDRLKKRANAIKLYNGQAVKIEGRYYTAALTSGRPAAVRLIPHDLDEPGART